MLPADFRWRTPGQPGPDLELEDKDGFTALMLGASAINQVKLLLRAGADPNHASSSNSNRFRQHGII